MTNNNKELAIELIPHSGFILYITTKSMDAALWVQEIAPRFGELFPTDKHGVYRLYVDLQFKTRTAVAALEGYYKMSEDIYNE